MGFKASKGLAQRAHACRARATLSASDTPRMRQGRASCSRAVAVGPPPSAGTNASEPSGRSTVSSTTARPERWSCHCHIRRPILCPERTTTT